MHTIKIFFLKRRMKLIKILKKYSKPITNVNKEFPINIPTTRKKRAPQLSFRNDKNYYNNKKIMKTNQTNTSEQSDLITKWVSESGNSP